MKPLPLTFDRLRETNVRLCEAAFHPLNSWTPNDWATALAGEVGELCNLLKKVRRGEDIPILDIAREAADVQIYLDLLTARLGIDLGTATIEKFNVVSDRRNCTIKLADVVAERAYDLYE